MKKTGNIYGLDSLEKEIYQLRLKKAETEKKLDENFTWLRKNASTLFVHSFFSGKKEKRDHKRNGREGFFKSQRMNAMFNTIADRISDRAAESIDSLLDRIFSKHRHHSGE